MSSPRQWIQHQNKHLEERLPIPEFMRTARHDSDGRLHRLAAVGMLVIAVFQFRGYRNRVDRNLAALQLVPRHEPLHSGLPTGFLTRAAEVL